MDVISKINNLFTHEINEMNKLIKSFAIGHEELISIISNHLIFSGGKRLRPLLTLISARLLNYQGNRHIYLATSVEFIHTATLLHDDVVDESELRRGIDTANNIWGNKASILVGDFLLSQAFKIMVSDGSLDVLNILSEASAVIAKGEVMQLAACHDLSLTYEDYILIIKSKTAELFAAACQISAVITNQDKKIEEALRNYGMNLGISFQIIDDYLDYFSNHNSTGKSVGNDFTESKITLPIILAYQYATKEEKEFWGDIFIDKKIGNDSFQDALYLFKKYKIDEMIFTYAKNYIELAKKELDVFPESEAKNILIEILDFSLKRLY